MEFIKAKEVYYETLINLERIVEAYHKERYDAFKTRVIDAIEEAKTKGKFYVNLYFRDDLPDAVQSLIIKELKECKYEASVDFDFADFSIEKFLAINWNQE